MLVPDIEGHGVITGRASIALQRRPACHQQCLLTSTLAAVGSIKYLRTFIISELLFIHLLLSLLRLYLYCK